MTAGKNFAAEGAHPHGGRADLPAVTDTNDTWGALLTLEGPTDEDLAAIESEGVAELDEESLAFLEALEAEFPDEVLS